MLWPKLAGALRLRGFGPGMGPACMLRARCLLSSVSAPAPRSLHPQTEFGCDPMREPSHESFGRRSAAQHCKYLSVALERCALRCSQAPTHEYRQWPGLSESGVEVVNCLDHSRRRSGGVVTGLVTG